MKLVCDAKPAYLLITGDFNYRINWNGDHLYAKSSIMLTEAIPFKFNTFIE